MRVGYIRVSAKDQNEDRQVKLLEDAKVEKVYMEKISGKNMDRPELLKMLGFVREGDFIVIESISRLARNTLDFLTIVRDLDERKIGLMSLKENIDTSTPTGKFIMTVFGALYEMERDTIRQRQREGIDVALEKGTKFGRPKVEIDERFKSLYKEWKNDQITAREAMKQLGLKPNTFYRRVSEMEA